jgi:hypothetical protein
MIGVLGMLAGAFAYVWFYPAVERIAKSLPDLGRLTIPEATGTPVWLWVAGLVAAAALALHVIDAGRRRPREPRNWREKSETAPSQ